ncbi:TRAP transporter TatT component family protein [Arenimonas composti]|uniref:TRAP transporter TatT component family protein n=1 Tax=Arenimonas composti TaxID=370776 RepID=UPI0005C16749|nr:TRAP transporter TatT component family protein [Arenimonas composti]
MRAPLLRLAALLAAAALLAGCASLVGRAGDRLAGRLGTVILASDDPATVRDALPAYLLLLDAMLIEGDGDDAGRSGLLFAAAELNGAYAGNFTGDDRERARRLAGKAFAYARRGVCTTAATLCARIDGDVDGFAQAVADAPPAQAPAMYALAAAWAGQLQANSDDWGAIADLPKVQALLERVVAIDPGHARGMARVYLGVLDSLRPEAVGGRPERGRAHFEAAIAQSGGRNLYASTLFAEYYARLVFDRELHDRLLREVLAADPHADGYTLTNVLAQQRARTLLASGDDYF